MEANCIITIRINGERKLEGTDGVVDDCLSRVGGIWHESCPGPEFS
jgi:hypothetical protein